MAITLEGNYSKKIGLPDFSSHQFSLTLKTEITDVAQIQTEAAKLYQQLQQGVDNSIKEVGFLPGPLNGKPNGNGNARPNGQPPREEAWQCSPKQKDLIIRIVDENNVDKSVIEQLATDRFGKGVKQLNKLEASGLIEELLEKYPRQQRNGRQNTPQGVR